ncbi:YchJ family protein [bacterium]|nr:YchJ family protein [bacterium]
MSKKTFTSCPCDSGKKFKECCEPFLTGAEKPKTAEALMRSRYSAFASHNTDYILETIDPQGPKDYDRASIEAWATNSEWKGLEIVSTDKGASHDNTGMVEFKAKFKAEGNDLVHHEKAQFLKRNGVWFYADGKVLGAPTVKRETPKIGRNDPCSCGSGKKFKKCCGA